MSNHIPGDLDPSSCVFLMCDIQEKFRPAISNFEAVVENARRLTSASNILNIPLIVTEQYPKGLGNTVAEIPTGHAKGVFEKTKFSMFVPEVDAALREDQSLDQIVLFGVETHVCIQQTVLDLIKKGRPYSARPFEVFLVADASSSRSNVDRKFALERLRALGAIVTTTESILFQLVGDKNHPNFKEIQYLVKTLPPDAGLL